MPERCLATFCCVVDKTKKYQTYSNGRYCNVNHFDYSVSTPDFKPQLSAVAPIIKIK